MHHFQDRLRLPQPTRTPLRRSIADKYISQFSNTPIQHRADKETFTTPSTRAKSTFAGRSKYSRCDACHKAPSTESPVSNSWSVVLLSSVLVSADSHELLAPTLIASPSGRSKCAGPYRGKSVRVRWGNAAPWRFPLSVILTARNSAEIVATDREPICGRGGKRGSALNAETPRSAANDGAE